MMEGKVKWFDDEKGYGFLTHPNVKNDIFVHYSAIQMEGYKQLDAGDQVRFELEGCEKGLFARKVHRIEQAAAKPVAGGHR